MRTTVSIQDEALELCKNKAQEKGKTIGEVISERSSLPSESGRIKAELRMLRFPSQVTEACAQASISIVQQRSKTSWKNVRES